MAGQQMLRAVILLWTSMQVILAGLTAALIFYITVDRDLGTAAVGIILSGFAVGSLLGASPLRGWPSSPSGG